MHVHQLPMLQAQLDRISQQPAPKPEDAARARAVFEQMTALAVNERSPNDRKRPRMAKPEQGKTGQTQTATVPDPAAHHSPRPTHDGGINILV